MVVFVRKIKRGKLDKEHNILCVNVTFSGINFRVIVNRLINKKESLGLLMGPAISDSKGNLYIANKIDHALQEVLEDLFEEDQTLFPPDIKNVGDIVESYCCFRSLRRALDTCALEMRVSQTDTDCVNRLGKDQRNTKGIKVKLHMRQHYAQPDLLIKPFYGTRGQCNEID